MSPESELVEVLDSADAYMAQTKGEIDMQIATAHRFPRKLSKFKKDALSMATIDPQTAEQCHYSLPRGSKKIEGPSVRLAEIIAGAWGNLRVQSRVIGIDDKHVTCQGVCHDLETNFASSVEVKRRITDRNGKRYNDDMISVTANAGCGVAFRNAVFKVVPKAHWNHVYEETKRVALGDVETLPARRNKALKFFADKGIKKEQILTKLGVSEIEDIDLQGLQDLRGIITAIEEGDTTLTEAFAPEKKESKLGAGRRKVKDEPGNVPLTKVEDPPTEKPTVDPTETWVLNQDKIDKVLQAGDKNGWSLEQIEVWLNDQYVTGDQTPMTIEKIESEECYNDILQHFTDTVQA